MGIMESVCVCVLVCVCVCVCNSCKSWSRSNRRAIATSNSSSSSDSTRDPAKIQPGCIRTLFFCRLGKNGERKASAAMALMMSGQSIAQRWQLMPASDDAETAFHCF